MTLDEFFTELLKLKDQYRWTEWNHGIRANLDLCYITALYHNRTRRSLNEFQSIDCAAEMGLSKDDAREIIAICDNHRHPLYDKYKELLCSSN